MRTPSEDLYELIHALEKSEKRMFKLFAKNLGGASAKRYALLFDLIDTAPSPDETALRERLRKHPEGRPMLAQLSVYKNQLQELVFKCLRHLHQSESVEETLLLALQNIKLLYRKRLFTQARAQLDEALQLAERFDKVLYLPRLYEWRFLLENAVFFFAEWEEGRFEREIQAYRQQADALARYVDARNRCTHVTRAMRRHPHSLSPEAQETLEAERPFWERVCAEALPEGVGVSTHIALLQGKALWASLERQAGLVACAWLELAEYLEQQADILTDPDVLRVYFNALISALGFAREGGDAGRFGQAFERLQRIDQSKLPSWARLYHHNAQMIGALHNLDFGMAEEHFLQAKELMAQGAFPEVSVVTAWYAGAAAAFWRGQWAETHERLEQVLGFPRLVAPLVNAAGRFLRLLLAYEQAQWELLPYQARGLYRHLKKRHQLFGYERVLLRFFHHAGLSESARERRRWLRRLVGRLQRVEADPDPAQREPMYYFHFLRWAKAKLGAQK